MVALAREIETPAFEADLFETDLRRTPPAWTEPRRIERRLFDRQPTDAAVLARRIDNTLPARQQPRLICTLRDLSPGGLSAISPAPLEVGERVSFSFVSRGPSRACDRFGRVLRCEGGAPGYRIAVEFDSLPAA